MQKKGKNLLSTVVVASFISLLIGFLLYPTETITSDTETVYERVMRTGEIRCGYNPYQPAFFIDPNTEKFSGIFHDLTMEMGKRLGLKIIWEEEVGWGEMITGLAYDRYDMVCTVMWATAPRARQIDFSIPLYYSNVYAWVRSDDDRFGGNVQKLNNKDYRLIEIEGSATTDFARNSFPNTNYMEVPQLTSYAETISYVINKKADAILLDLGTTKLFLEKNPGSIKRINKTPITKFPNVMGLPGGEHRFNQMINHTLRQLILEGYVDQLLEKYNVHDSYSPASIN